MYKQRLHVKTNLNFFLNSIKLFLLFSTQISSTEMSHMFSTEMSWYRRAPPPNPRETSERINFNFNLYIDIWCLVFKKKCHKMIVPSLCHLDQWLIFYWPKFFFRASQRLALISGTVCVMWILFQLDAVIWTSYVNEYK